MGAPLSSSIVITGHRWPMARTNFPMFICFWNTSSPVWALPFHVYNPMVFHTKPLNKISLSLSLSLTCACIAHINTHTHSKGMSNVCHPPLPTVFCVPQMIYQCLASPPLCISLWEAPYYQPCCPSSYWPLWVSAATQSSNPRKVHTFCLYLFHPVSGSALISTSLDLVSILHHSQQDLVS